MRSQTALVLLLRTAGAAFIAFVAVPAWAELEPLSLTTADGKIHFKGTLPAGTQFVEIDSHLIEGPFRKTESVNSYRSEVAVSPVRPLPAADLKLGEGLYSVVVWYEGKDQRFFASSEWRIVSHAKPDLFTTASDDVSSNAPEIIALAKSLTHNKTNDSEKALAIHDWVSKNIHYNVDRWLTPLNAVITLQKRVGICHHFAVLYAALARAAGLETKVVGGFGGRVASVKHHFENHAWNEVRIDGNWVPVDTTYDAHYTHDIDSGDSNLIAAARKRGPEVMKFADQTKLATPVRAFFALQNRSLFDKYHIKMSTNPE